MASEGYEAIVVGGGFAGLSIAYALARRKVRVLLVEASGLASGASGGNAGRAQISEGPQGAHMELVLHGIERLGGLEEELGARFEWRRLGNLMLIEHERHWRHWEGQVRYLQGLGVPARMLERRELQGLEPGLRVDRYLGAAWCLEGHLNPFLFCHAYAQAARRHGAKLRQGCAVTGFEQRGGRIVGVRTREESLAADNVIITAGAWSGRLLEMAGVHLPVRFTHAEAMISEPIAPLLHNHVGLADFYETIHNQPQAVSVGIAQHCNGTLLVTEAVEMAPEIRRRNSPWGMPGMARDVLALIPALAPVQIVREWGVPSPFLPDNSAAIGRAPGWENLFVATCFLLTIPTIPVLSEMMAELVAGGVAPPVLAEFDPGRFA